VGSTNILPWNPTGANQETDAAYAADSQRSGGATNPSFFLSVLANKLFFQMTAVAYSLCTAMAAKGFTMDDNNTAAMIAAFEQLVTSAAILPPLVVETFASSMTFNCTTANGFYVLLTGNVTSLTVSGAMLGQPVMFVFKQDSTGGRTVAMPGNMINFGTPDPTANATSIQWGIELPDGNIHAVTGMTVS
jgi:hypothetical protein